MTDKAQVVADEPIRGLAEVYDEVVGAGDDEMIERLESHAKEVGLPPPGGRSDRAAFAWIKDRLAGRTFVEDLGTHDLEVEWLHFHVPPGGTGSLALRTTSQGKMGLQLKLFGSGYGGGRAVKLSATENYGQRSKCTRLLLAVTVRAQRFRVRSGLVEDATTVVGARGTRVVSVPKCDLCGTPVDELNPIRFRPHGQLGIDLSADTVGVQRSQSIELSAEDELELGFSVSVPQVGDARVGLTARRAYDFVCETEYNFPAGASFVPFERWAPSVQLPFWAVV